MTITQKPSPNFDSNRVKIDRILIHWMAGNMASADAQFAKPNSTSAHYGIENDQVHQYVQENKVAYHAGNYLFNQRSIGIEHSAAPDRPASEETYKTSGQLVREIAQRYGIPLDRQHIMRHSEVVATQCCGTVDIDKIIAIAKGATPPANESQQDKQVQFDRILSFYKSKNYVQDDASEKYTKPVNPDGLLNIDKDLWKDREIDRPKASKWGQTVTYFYDMKLKDKDGNLIIPVDDSNVITFEQVKKATEAVKAQGGCKPEDLKKTKEQGRIQGRQEIKDIVKGLA